jgi:hypothetical protein
MMGSGFEDPAREIVGVVGDVKQTGLDGGHVLSALSHGAVRRLVAGKTCRCHLANAGATSGVARQTAVNPPSHV